MLFTELVFFLFFAVCFPVRWLLPGYRAQKVWLLVCSYVFYGWWDWRFLFLLLGSTLVDYAVGLALGGTEEHGRRRALLLVSLVVQLGALGFFKYTNFFLSIVAPDRATAFAIILPVGISFFTFQTLSYSIDVYRREIPPTRSLVDFALFVSFFPQLVAGPIVRARDFLPQLDVAPRLADVDVRPHLARLLSGFFKKAVVADAIALAIDPLFADPGAHGAADLVLAALLYSVQIYCDFSGYTDIAIGLAGLLGYRLEINFAHPYLATNPAEFWRRWHISLSTWFRDYLYVPLGGNRGSAARVAFNLFFTMLVAGLWHGANWTFVLWGALHGAALVAHRAFRRGKPHAPTDAGPARRLACWMLTFGWVVACFALFRCPDVGAAAALFRGILRGDGPAPLLDARWWLLLAVLGAAHVATARPEARSGARWLPDALFYPAVGAGFALLPFLLPMNAAPFIYFQF